MSFQHCLRKQANQCTINKHTGTFLQSSPGQMYAGLGGQVYLACSLVHMSCHLHSVIWIMVFQVGGVLQQVGYY